jgi:Fe2+ or Zn2+ uptake regulation protein
MHESITQTSAIRQAIAGVRGRFSVDKIGEIIRGKGQNITNQQVGRILAKLQHAGAIRVTAHGSGITPNQYERTDRFEK